MTRKRSHVHTPAEAPTNTAIYRKPNQRRHQSPTPSFWDRSTTSYQVIFALMTLITLVSRGVVADALQYVLGVIIALNRLLLGQHHRSHETLEHLRMTLRLMRPFRWLTILLTGFEMFGFTNNDEGSNAAAGGQTSGFFNSVPFWYALVLLLEDLSKLVLIFGRLGFFGYRPLQIYPRVMNFYTYRTDFQFVAAALRLVRFWRQGFQSAVVESVLECCMVNFFLVRPFAAVSPYMSNFFAIYVGSHKVFRLLPELFG